MSRSQMILDGRVADQADCSAVLLHDPVLPAASAALSRDHPSFQQHVVVQRVSPIPRDTPTPDALPSGMAHHAEPVGGTVSAPTAAVSSVPVKVRVDERDGETRRDGLGIAEDDGMEILEVVG
jgi:hypothetical protein